MQIPTLYVLFAGEFLLILLAVILFLAWRLVKRRSREDSTEPEVEETPPPGYSDYLEQELQRTEQKAAETRSTDEEQADGDDSSRLLQARKLFLDTEKSAAKQQGEDDSAFWASIFEGMKNVVKHFETTRVEQVEHEKVVHKTETREKVFYVETQGKKVDDEVNKLKDIIYDQENALSSLAKAMKKAHQHFPEDSEDLAHLQEQMDNLERQLRDSRVCMEVLEMENQRLQDQLHKTEAGGSGALAAGGKPTEEGVNLAELKEVLDKQDRQIEQLQQTIDELELETSQSEKLKATINEFAHTSQEMMGCIAILEEENDHLKEELHNIRDSGAQPAATGSNDEETEALKASIKKLEEELIRKEVEYAKLQDEFTDMEKEYLAMYEALHGDK